MHIHAKYNPDLTVSKEMETGYYNHKERNSIKTYIFEADSSSDPLDKTGLAQNDPRLGHEEAGGETMVRPVSVRRATAYPFSPFLRQAPGPPTQWPRGTLLLSPLAAGPASPHCTT